MKNTSLYILSDLERNLHLTLVPAFSIPNRVIPELERLLQHFASLTPAITANVKLRGSVIDEDGFDFRVSKLESPHIADAHHTLWQGIKNLGGVSERPLFIEGNYLAHITSDETLEEGTEIKISSLRLSRFNKVTKTEHYSSETFQFA